MMQLALCLLLAGAAAVSGLHMPQTQSLASAQGQSIKSRAKEARAQSVADEDDTGKTVHLVFSNHLVGYSLAISFVIIAVASSGQYHCNLCKGASSSSARWLPSPYPLQVVTDICVCCRT